MIVSIVNNKGGVGKTTVAVNLSHALAKMGKQVLVVDNDTQANTTSIFLPTEPEKSLYEVLEGSEVREVIQPSIYENLSILPNIPETSGLEMDLIEKSPESLSILEKKLRPAIENFDYTFIDCPPNMGTFVILALQASDFVIIPTEAGCTFSIEGLLRAVKLIERIAETGNPNLRFLRLLFNYVDKRTSISRYIIRQVKNHFKEDQVFETVIPTNTTFQQAILSEKTIISYNSSASGAKAFRSLAKEFNSILENLNENERIRKAV